MPIKFGSFCANEFKNNQTVRPHQLPIYATSSFEFETIEEGIDIFKGNKKGLVYGRYGNPTMETVARKIAAMETFDLDMTAKGIMTSSGMSAISTLFLSLLKSGDNVLTQGNLYGGTTELLKKVLAPCGIAPMFTDLQDLNQVEQLLRDNPAIRLLYFETPANPTMACVDIEQLCALAAKYNCLTAIDNTFCTPYLQQPFKYGADFIIHSTTKFLNGQGNSIAGVIIGRDLELMEKKVWVAMKLMGTNCNPFDAWLVNNGLKTLAIRMDRHSENAQQIAEYLEGHEKVARVNYNGLPSHPDHLIAKKQMRQFGGMLSFELADGLEAGLRFMNAIKLCTLAPTLGDVDTLVLHPASSSHINVDRDLRLKNGITDGLIRLSVGIEDVEDLIGDIDRAIG